MFIQFSISPARSLVRGLFSLALGIVFLAVPGLSLKSVVMTTGAMILVNGLFVLLSSYRSKRKPGNGTPFFQGLFYILLGCIVLLAPMTIVRFTGYFFGFIFLVVGTMQFFGAAGSITRSAWSWVYLLFGTLLISGGLFLLFYPVKSAEHFLTFLGVLLALYGFLEILSAWRYRKMKSPGRRDNTIDTTYEEV